MQTLLLPVQDRSRNFEESLFDSHWLLLRHHLQLESHLHWHLRKIGSLLPLSLFVSYPQSQSDQDLAESLQSAFLPIHFQEHLRNHHKKAFPPLKFLPSVLTDQWPDHILSHKLLPESDFLLLQTSLVSLPSFLRHQAFPEIHTNK